MRALPLGLTGGGQVIRAVRADGILTVDDVTLAETSAARRCAAR